MNGQVNLHNKIQEKAKSAIRVLRAIREAKGSGLELTSVKIELRSYAAEIKPDGSFFIVTGTKNSPAGFGTGEYDLVMIYREATDYGIFIESQTIKEIIRSNRELLKIGIDEEYKHMGVWLNLGILINHLDEDFLSALSQTS